MFKMALYIVTLPIVIYALEAIKIEQIFKQGRVLQIRIAFLLISFSLDSLFVNFLYDFALQMNFR